jgi:hypothetical protein
MIHIAPKAQPDDATTEVRNLLKKLLILRLFELRVSQGDIAKKLKVDINTVNEFLKGIKRADA